MKTSRVCFVVLGFALLTGCAGGGASYERVKNAKTATELLQQRQYFEAFQKVKGARAFNDARDPVVALLTNDPNFAAEFRNALNQQIASVGKPTPPEDIEWDLEVASSVGLMSQAERAQFVAALQTSITTAIVAGQLQLACGKIATKYPGVFKGPALDAVLDNCIHELLTDPPQPQIDRRIIVASLFEGLARPSAAAERAKFERSLSKIRFTIVELKTDIAPVFPKFASAQLQDQIVPITLQVLPPRRLLEIGLNERLAKYAEIELTGGKSKPRYAVEIEELEYREQQPGSNTRSVTVGYYDANPVYSALYMPKNASFLYDVVEREQRVEWSYEIRLRGASGMRSKVVGDIVRSSSHQCANPRIVNVFGGISSASGWPNQQTENFCAVSTNLPDMSAVREQILDQVAAAAAALIAER